MGTINDYLLKYGQAGFARLAKRAGTKVSYLNQLNYDTNKRPSMEMAQRLVKASGGEITLDGLANPKKRLVREVQKEAEASALRAGG
jgi:hypothetical protein